MTVKQVLSQFAPEAWESSFVSPTDIRFTPEVRAACAANLCGRYGKTWTCPPGVGELDDLRRHYQDYPDAFVFTTRHLLEDDYDWEGMQAGQRTHAAVEEKLLEQLMETGKPFELLGAGSCSRCEKCTYPDAPCRLPHLARPSLEACGIDVVQLAKTVGIHYNNGESTVTYFSVVFFTRDDQAKN